MPFGYFIVKYGSLTDLEVVVDPKTRDLWITVPTLERLLGWDADSGRKKLASKSLKRTLEKESAVGKTTGKLITGKDIQGRNNRVKAIPFAFALKVIYWQIKEDNEKALQLVMSGFAESFTSLALEQAGIQVSVAERQEILSLYLNGYHEFFDWVRDQHLKVTGKPAQNHHYININKAIDKVVCHKPDFEGNRKKNATRFELHKIESFQRYFMDERAIFYPTDKPYDAVKTELKRMYAVANELLN